MIDVALNENLDEVVVLVVVVLEKVRGSTCRTQQQKQSHVFPRDSFELPSLCLRCQCGPARLSMYDDLGRGCGRTCLLSHGAQTDAAAVDAILLVVVAVLTVVMLAAGDR